MIRRVTVDTPLGPVGLASDETLVSIEPSPLVPPAEPAPPLEILLRMAGVDRVADLGSRGPVIASAANEENAGNPELRRYEAKFARDALYAAEFLADRFPQLEDGTVRYFSAYQAVSTDPRRMSEPGKIAHHIRDPTDPLAQQLTRETGRLWPWFGATDATVQFLSAACRVLDRKPGAASEEVRYALDHRHAGGVIERDGKPLTLARTIHAAAGWLLDKLSANGLLWAGLNRKDSFTVWTDSPNAFHHRNGLLATPPVAPVQLQAQVFDALVALATHAAALTLDPALLLRAADRLRTVVLDRFVVTDERGTFLASAVERGDPLAVRTVSMGFTLDSGLLDGPSLRGLRDDLVRQLFGPELSSPFGFTGRARDEVRFEPFDYHAQVWGFAVHKVARGLARHGYVRESEEANARLLLQTRDGLLPENVGAHDSDELRYCPHILTVWRPGPDGRPTITVKERPPAPYAAWTVAAVLAVRPPPPSPH